MLAQDGFSKLLAAGLTFGFALQTFIIVGGVLRLIPLTGITLPFVSYGGSSLLANFVLLAGLLLVSNRALAPRGIAIAVDYGHLADGRPPFGSLRSYRDGTEVDVAVDGSCDVTAHVAVDAVADRVGATLVRQRDAGGQMYTRLSIDRALEIFGIVPFGPVGGSLDFALTRYTTTGALDPSFGNGGKVITEHVRSLHKGSQDLVLDHADFGNIISELLKQANAHLRTLLLTATELNHGLDLVPGTEETHSVTTLGFVVVLVNLQSETDLLEYRIRLVLARFTGLDCSFVLILAKIHELAHRRLGLRCDLNKIQIRLGGQTQGVLNTDNTDLFSSRSYQPHLRDADPIIDSWLANVLLLLFW